MKQKEDYRITQMKCLLDTIGHLDYPSDIMKSVAVVLTLREENIPDVRSMAIAVRVLDVQKLCRALMTYEERVLALLCLAKINGKVDNDDADGDICNGVAEVLTWDDDTLAREIDEAGTEGLNQIAENYWGCNM